MEDVATCLLQSFIFILALENVYHNFSLPLYNQGKSYICVAVMLIYVYVFPILCVALNSFRLTTPTQYRHILKFFLKIKRSLIMTLPEAFLFKRQKINKLTIMLSF